MTHVNGAWKKVWGVLREKEVGIGGAYTRRKVTKKASRQGIRPALRRAVCAVLPE
jgi:hypothetical protein